MLTHYNLVVICVLICRAAIVIVLALNLLYYLCLQHFHLTDRRWMMTSLVVAS